MTPEYSDLIRAGRGRAKPAGVAATGHRPRRRCSSIWMSVLALSLVSLLAACGRADFAYADGSEGRFDDWQGRWVFVNYWAEWCAPCRHEIPELNELHVAHGERAMVVGVNFDRLQGDELLAVMERMDVRFPVMLADPAEQFGQARPQRLPTTFVLDPAGDVVAVLEGPQTRADLERVAELAGTE
jgi:thiol-disulfide isomerase/thioredoxin